MTQQHTPDFSSKDTVRNNSYMKKISNQKHQTLKRLESIKIDSKIIDQVRNMELNKFKNAYETSLNSNQTLDQILLSSLNQTSQTDNTVNQDSVQSIEESNIIQTDQNKISTFADNLEADDQTQQGDMQDNTQESMQDQTVKHYGMIEKTKDGSGIIKRINGVRIIEPSYQTLLNATKETYKQRSDEIKQLDLAFDREYKKGILFQGGSGVGKTLLSLYYASIRKLPCVFLSCHSGITKDELIGSYQLVDNNSAYVLGEIIQAIVCANNSPHKRSVLILDELNCLTSDTQKILNEMLRFKDGITIAELGIKYKLNPDCKILVLATANPLSYQGTNELNAELESRLEIIEVPDLSSNELRDLITTDYNLDSEFLDNMIRLKEMIVEYNTDSKLDKGYDTREFVKTIDQYTQLIKNNYDHDTAIRKSITSCLYGKFSISDDDEQSKTVRETIESCLAIDPSDLKWF
jgi:MoxR-like ATPase